MSDESSVAAGMTSAVDRVKPEPCPFCGGAAVVAKLRSRPDVSPWPAVLCSACGVRTETCADEERAIAAWNRRAPVEAEPVGADEVDRHEAYQEGFEEGSSEAKGVATKFWCMVQDWAERNRFIEPEADGHTAQDLMDAVLVAFGERQAKRRTRPKAEAEDWRDDPASDERWNEGCDFAMTQLCKVLGVDPKSVTWDAATEELDGDVQAVIGNIMRKKYGEDWGPRDPLYTHPNPSPSAAGEGWLTQEEVDLPLYPGARSKGDDGRAVLGGKPGARTGGATPPTGPSDERAWLLERADSDTAAPWYWAAGQIDPSRSSAWTQNHMAAIRFARREDAQAVADRLMRKVPVDVRVCEHEWSGK